MLNRPIRLVSLCLLSVALCALSAGCLSDKAVQQYQAVRDRAAIAPAVLETNASFLDLYVLTLSPSDPNAAKLKAMSVQLRDVQARFSAFQAIADEFVAAMRKTPGATTKPSTQPANPAPPP